jgi:hypothetical protein
MLARSDLDARHDFAASRARVLEALDEAMRTREGRLRLLGRYTCWNGWFGSGVASLAGKIGRSRAVFEDPAQPVRALADRSVFVASYFFDAARDEFDDRDTTWRDTHRCLAQATVLGLVARDGWSPEDADAVLAEPLWLGALGARVAQGYGVGSPDTAMSIFRAMGYHLGSEVLADQEFTSIDATLRRHAPDLVSWLAEHPMEIAGQPHDAYAWIRIHSGHGGGVEAEHFEHAVQGVRRGLEYAVVGHREALKHQVLLGFDDFVRDHAEFFAQVNR